MNKDIIFSRQMNVGATFVVTIDKRKMDENKANQEFPIAVRVSHKHKHIYLPCGMRMTEEAFMELCALRNKPYNKKRINEIKSLERSFEKALMISEELDVDGLFSLQLLKERFKGVAPKDVSIYTIWQSIIDAKNAENKAATADSYKNAFNRFVKDIGKNIQFADVTNELLLKWRRKMTSCGISIATQGMYLRTFRIVVRICNKQGLIRQPLSEIFANTKYNDTVQRKEWNLNASQMQELFDFFLKGNFDAPSNQVEAVIKHLGLFLFSYLGNGQNIADTLNLRWDKFYFQTASQGEPQLRFNRKKTRDKSQDHSEVKFAITAEMQQILDRIGTTPKRDERVFDMMQDGLTARQETAYIKSVNHRISKHLKVVTKLLGWDENITPCATYARHSFGTVLAHNNVKEHYVSCAMGHSTKKDITSIYIDNYSYSEMVEKSQYLLSSTDKKAKKTRLHDMGFSDEEICKILELKRA